MGKWGNATGIRIPQPFLQQLGLRAGDTVSLMLDGERIVIEPSQEQNTLQARMKDWDGKRYQTDEYDWGELAGEEVW